MPENARHGDAGAENGAREGGVGRWLTRGLTRGLAPATESGGQSQAAGLALLRVVLGLMWLYNLAWKRPPRFESLQTYIGLAVSHPVLPPYSLVVEKVVLPNLAVFGWGVLTIETALAVLLLTGAWVRAAAVLGAAQSLVIGLSVALAPEEWPWAYYLMFTAHVVLLLSPSGRAFAVDAVRARLGSARRLCGQWGAIAVVAGTVAAVASVASEGAPFGARGVTLGSGELEIGIGVYNLPGSLALVLTGGLMLMAARSGNVHLDRTAAVVAVLAALSLHAQIGFTGPFLGGTATSAGLLLALALVAVTTGGELHRSTLHRPTPSG